MESSMGEVGAWEIQKRVDTCLRRVDVAEKERNSVSDKQPIRGRPHHSEGQGSQRREGKPW
jgi:hypothetical protein